MVKIKTVACLGCIPSLVSSEGSHLYPPLPYGEAHVPGTEGGIQPAASKELNPASDQLSEFGSGSSSIRAFR